MAIPTLHRLLKHEQLYWLTMAEQEEETVISPTGRRVTWIGWWFRDPDPERSRFYLRRGLHLHDWVPHELLDGTIWANPNLALVEVIEVPGPLAGSGPRAWVCAQTQAGGEE